MSIVRFGVSLEKELLEALDHYALKNSFPNRSQAIRHLISENTVQEKWDQNQEVAGAITIVYDHHKRNILHTLNNIQHDYHSIILSNLHFHIDHHNCMEIIAVKGRAVCYANWQKKSSLPKGLNMESLR
jgi:CopG family nickel-responsive transcriptional regulator